MTGTGFFILDADLEGVNCFDLCRKIVSERPGANVLVMLDATNAAECHDQLLHAGARGFCLKTSDTKVLDEAIDRVRRGLDFCDPGLEPIIKHIEAATPVDEMARFMAEQSVAELTVELAIANEHLKVLSHQIQLLEDALAAKKRTSLV
jgi:DNA-binding NarL/FixJ family response regulator